jgi:hypothetical protein
MDSVIGCGNGQNFMNAKKNFKGVHRPTRVMRALSHSRKAYGASVLCQLEVPMAEELALPS